MIYVCYEENSLELSYECYHINMLYASLDLDKVIKWAKRTIENAKHEGYEPLDETEIDRFISKISELNKNDDVCSIDVFKNGSEDSEYYYSIIIQAKCE